MSATPQSTISILVRFSRVLADATSPAAIPPLLAEAAQSQLNADAAAVFSVSTGGQLVLAAARGLPPDLSGWRIPADAIGPELGDRLLRACQGRFQQERTWPLVSGGDIFGALVLLFRSAVEIKPIELEIIHAFGDLAAIALGKAFQFDELSRSYAELRASRQVLARVEKLRALGQMAAGVSHDLKNLLSPLLLQVQQLRRRSERGQDLGPVLDRMERVLRQGVDHVERLRHFSRQAPEAPAEPVQINDLIPEVVALCEPRLRLTKNIELRQELGHPPRVLLSPGELVSAALNLVVNAIDALASQGGIIALRTRAAEGGALLEVADNGPGLPPLIQEHLFEPFLTTKGEEGTGLGLPMVYAFVQRHGGTISVDSGPQKGTRFCLWFPAA
ncbi:MAG: HAMP domain-containing sensor histidine kinase [Myxococcales bacterium]|nr:HAMP domain-containing histidine kinase [Myxococcota bacterium]MDW8281352.1 HAMP domain-containing sensor histidine kinase [Myxococcales bacterium]